MAKIYVASSWRNPYFADVVSCLRAAGHEVYDFRNPPHGGHGFKWAEIAPDMGVGAAACAGSAAGAGGAGCAGAGAGAGAVGVGCAGAGTGAGAVGVGCAGAGAGAGAPGVVGAVGAATGGGAATTEWTFDQYRQGLKHPKAERQFAADLEAMQWADTCVLVLPCGRSAHTEAGWFSGRGLKTIAYIPQFDEPELMYKLFDAIVATPTELLEALK